MTSASWLLAAYLLYWVAALAIAALAWWKADWGEKAGATALLLNFGLSLAMQGIYWRGVQIGVLAADMMLLIVLAVVAYRVPRWWARAAAGFAVVSCIAHPAAAFSPDIWMIAYLAAQWVFSGLIVLAMAAGLVELPFARRHQAWRAPPPR